MGLLTTTAIVYTRTSYLHHRGNRGFVVGSRRGDRKKSSASHRHFILRGHRRSARPLPKRIILNIRRRPARLKPSRFLGHSGERRPAAASSGGANLGALETIEPEGLSSVQEGEWEVLEFAVDSGASETVINQEMISSVERKEGPASRRGVSYEVANGVRIPNLGEKRFSGSSDEGVERTLTAQVCDVNKALLSVRKVVAAGNRVVFDNGGSYIEDKSTGERMWMTEQNGMYMLKMWIPRKAQQPFPRQG
ncbi:hypothetical protein N9L68_05645 [bacterium]|nr:hypothetical protein [bacterium]